MRRIHIALAVDDLDVTIADYTERLGTGPVTIVAGKYALWRTAEVNLSVNADTGAEQRLRHIGFEDTTAGDKTEDVDVNGIMWETFTPTWQDHGIARLYGNPTPD